MFLKHILQENKDLFFFLENEIDGSVLIDEIDGLNDDIIKELIPSLGTQLKFKKALRILRKYI
jgi:hypothetical protein